MTGRAVLAVVLSLAVLLALGGGLVRVAGRVQAQSAAPQGEVGIHATMGSAFTYQGRLRDGGTPAHGTYDFQLAVFPAQTGGATMSTVTEDDVVVNNGLFTLMLDFGHGIFRGDPRWLEVRVRDGASTGSYTTLTPRQALTPAPYALALPAMHIQQNEPSPNVIGGFILNFMGAGVTGATIGGGGRPGEVNQITADYGTVSGGYSNTVSSDMATIGGGSANLAAAGDATIAGGSGNVADKIDATVGGGSGNTASGRSAVVAGGGGMDFDIDIGYLVPNTASGNHSTVSGGGDNAASGARSTVSGGMHNTSSAEAATVGGGMNNDVTAASATIGGGERIEVTGDGSTVAGGIAITVTSGWSTVSGGANNAVYAPGHGFWESWGATIGGGVRNEAREAHSTISGGGENAASGYASTVGGGGGYSDFMTLLPEWTPVGNTATGDWSTVAGGGDNTAGAYAATVSGGYGNNVSADMGTIGGGGPESSGIDIPSGPNRVTDVYGTVGGGTGNTAGDDDGIPGNAPYTTIGGGKENTATWWGATVGGGEQNVASGIGATVGGGRNNGAAHDQATVGGGETNKALGIYATVGGGTMNEANETSATIAGGAENRAEAWGATVGGGGSNRATGGHSTVPGGEENIASGDYSFAAGYQANAGHEGAFVWCDRYGLGGCSSEQDNEFLARATGGVRFLTGLTEAWAGVRVRPGSSTWESISDRNAKENFAPVDSREVLEHLAEIPISTWNYKAEEGAVRHIGPMAQDFSAAFGVGSDERHISAVDPDGVALAAIQGLYEVVQEKDTRISELETQLADVEARLDRLESQQGTPVRQPWPPGPFSLLAGALILGAVFVGRNGGRGSLGAEER